MLKGYINNLDYYPSNINTATNTSQTLPRRLKNPAPQIFWRTSMSFVKMDKAISGDPNGKCEFNALDYLLLYNLLRLEPGDNSPYYNMSIQSQGTVTDVVQTDQYRKLFEKWNPTRNAGTNTVTRLTNKSSNVVVGYAANLTFGTHLGGSATADPNTGYYISASNTPGAEEFSSMLIKASYPQSETPLWEHDPAYKSKPSTPEKPTTTPVATEPILPKPTKPAKVVPLAGHTKPVSTKDYLASLAAKNLPSDLVSRLVLKLKTNPVLGILTLFSSQDLEAVDYTIYNHIGQKMLNGQFGASQGRDETTLDVGTLATGTYSLTLIHQGKTYVLKFIKE